MSRDFQATSEAYQKFAQVLKELESCKRLFDVAGEPLPEQLKEFFGRGSRSNGRSPKVDIPQLHRESRPPQAADDWISIELKHVMATNLVLAVLRNANIPVKAGDVVEMVTKLNSDATRGGIHNIGTRLDGKSIKRTPDGWSLIDANQAGIMWQGYFWGPLDIFEVQEKAAHRREAILHILAHFTGGLQIVQIVELLKGCSWMKAPASKDLLKADMEILRHEHKVRRISNSKKWVLEMEAER